MLLIIRCPFLKTKTARYCSLFRLTGEECYNRGMDFDEYQKLAARTGFYNHPDKQYVLMYLSMGLAGEAGEVIEKGKHIVRDQKIGRGSGRERGEISVG